MNAIMDKEEQQEGHGLTVQNRIDLAQICRTNKGDSARKIGRRVVCPILEVDQPGSAILRTSRVCPYASSNYNIISNGYAPSCENPDADKRLNPISHSIRKVLGEVYQSIRDRRIE